MGEQDFVGSTAPSTLISSVSLLWQYLGPRQSEEHTQLLGAIHATGIEAQGPALICALENGGSQVGYIIACICCVSY